jgi:hypothetical protein
MGLEVRAAIPAGALAAAPEVALAVALEVATAVALEVATAVSTVAVRAVGEVVDSPIARCVSVAELRSAPEAPQIAKEDGTTRCVRVW